MNQNERLEVGAKITLTCSAESDEGHVYSAGEVGQVADFTNGDTLVLVRFSGRPPLTCTIGDDCEFGAVVVA